MMTRRGIVEHHELLRAPDDRGDLTSSRARCCALGGHRAEEAATWAARAHSTGWARGKDREAFALCAHFRLGTRGRLGASIFRSGCSPHANILARACAHASGAVYSLFRSVSLFLQGRTEPQCVCARRPRVRTTFSSSRRRTRKWWVKTKFRG